MDLTLAKIDEAARKLAGVAVETPVLALDQFGWADSFDGIGSVHMKLELFQQAGSFKARGAYLGIADLTPQQRTQGVVAASGGNHALGVAWAAKAAGVRAQITMPEYVDPERIAACRALGADLTLHPDMPAAFAAMERIAQTGATLIHPFEAPHMVLGSATVAAEYLRQVPQIDTLVVPVGGGGLIAGMATAAKLIRPDIQIIGVEPIGADSIGQSISMGAPVTLDRIDTIADSLGAPFALPLTYGLAQANVDQMITLPDQSLLAGMEDLRRVLRLLAEPACAASLAAVKGPLRDQLAGRHVGIIACGSNIGLDRFTTLLAQRAD